MAEIHPKETLRREMKALRSQKAPAYPNAAIHAKDIFLENFSNFSNYALYYPMGDELSTLPLMEALKKLDKTICLPQLNDEGLLFKSWNEEPLQKSDYQFLEPSSNSPLIIPDLVLVPLLALDSQGYRLGYGKGHYDRVLQHLRQNHKLTTVGFAYSFQEVKSIPHEPHDQRLDYIVTEQGLFTT